MSETAPTLNPTDWQTQWAEDLTFPFVEDENANITGLGHQSPAAFARAVNHYDEVSTGEALHPDDKWCAHDIGWRWAVLASDGERLLTKVDRVHVTRETHPDAIPITTLWGQR